MTLLLLALAPAMLGFSQDLAELQAREVTLYRIAVVLYLLLLGTCAWLAVHRGRAMGLRLALFWGMCLLAMMAGVNFILGLMGRGPAVDGLCFPPYSMAHYESNEFSFDVQANNVGIRDASDVKPGPSSQTRVLVIGDSFVYGWGLAANQTWVSQLEMRVQTKDRPVELLNLGKPGTGPLDYARLAEVAIPYLQPDAVIVALLQTDDLHQSSHSERRQVGWGRFVSRPLDYMYPELMGALTRASIKHVRQTGTVWRQEAARYLSWLNTEERARLDALDPAVKEAFLQGRLNPGLMMLPTRYPNYFLELSDDNERSRSLSELLTAHLQRVKAACGNIPLLVVTIPYGPHTSRRDYDAFKYLGLAVDPSMLESRVPDILMLQAGRDAGAEVLSVMPEFRTATADTNPYFRLDRHFNAEGARIYAELLAPGVAAWLHRNSKK